ncbi:ABC transporter-like [Moorella glycerini]|uniref:High-affinity branched-chain amino acid transport ATP-binding protein LivF n=1 Tax=Neomoorella stamsii TaxID=1266720 RepID=A0A9X7J3R6_9FIRM|nr:MULTISPECIES: ABC transporter ATP-binding protein [Moorella]PRR73441.1 High-affinity branched-chain amino acid transport ATP-binding protein LivF [Moorella stamsii]CEP69210.1 ABC transporter-like [Moorella glycerini]
MLELRQVSTKYGQIPMLMQVSIKIDQGEAVCMLGANGAGKTTLLKTIIGMVKPVSGEVLFRGQRIDLWPSYKIIRSGIAIVPEREGLFPKLTVENNLLMGAYYEKDKSRIASRLEEVLTIFPRLKERLRQKAGTLSGGERKMLGIARALLADPQVLLMDEPSLGLAPATVNEVFAVIDRIKKEKKIAILLVEQNAQKALSVVERGYVLQKGTIILEGSTKELQENSIVKESYLSATS